MQPDGNKGDSRRGGYERELPRGRGPEMDQFGEQRTESEHEQSHITAIVANMSWKTVLTGC